MRHLPLLLGLCTALAAGADVLVTGDDDLLVLGRHDGILILAPRQFHDRYLGDAPDEAASPDVRPEGQ